MNPVVHLSRTKIVYLDGTVPSARFVFFNGRAAAWVEDRQSHTATRVLYAQDVQFHKPRSAKDPMLVYTDSIEEPLWTIYRNRTGGGCGCNAVIRNIPITTLLDPDVSSL